jgi:hypothetical protein
LPALLRLSIRAPGTSQNNKGKKDEGEKEKKT